MRLRLGLLLFAILTLVPRLAAAQAATTTAPPPPPPPRREGTAEFAFVGTSGNAETTTIGVGGELIYRPAPWETRMRVTYVRNEADDALRAETFVLLLRGQRPIRPRLSGFAQYGFQRDRFAGMGHRNTVEGGLAYTWIDQAPHKIVVDGAVGYANEARIIGTDLSTATLGAGALYTFRISDTSVLTDEARFVQSLADGSDWRVGNAVALTAKVSAILSLKVSNTIRHLNFPAVGFEKTDTITSVALVAKF